jgi:DNA modification methylase
MKTTHRIIQGNCLEVMSRIPANSIDFICADFPYNISNNP